MIAERPLPRGRHGIAPEVVIANQRQRLLAATASLIAERGYCALHVAHVTERAGVSRRTFYRFYTDKRDCILATQKHSIDSLSGRIMSAHSAAAGWPSGVALAIAAALEFAAEHLDEARLALAPTCAHFEPELIGNGLAANRRLASLLDQGAALYPGTRAGGRRVGERALGAAISILGPELALGDITALTELRPELTRVVLAPYLGEAQAHRISAAAEQKVGRDAAT